jgi:DNA-binding GntR family transcriptional regulator
MSTSDPMVRRIEDISLSERVTAELRRAVISGSLAPGQEFSLREIAGMLGVSFIPVREALRSLENEGLITTRRGRSAMVTPLDAGDLAAIYRLRRVVEPEIGGRSCLLLSEADLDALEEQAHSFGDERLGIDAIYAAHHEFHLRLLEPAATEWDIRVLNTLWRAAERYIRIGFGKLDPQPSEHSRREHAHEELLTAFRTRRPDAVHDAITRHLEHNETLAQNALDLA